MFKLTFHDCDSWDDYEEYCREEPEDEDYDEDEDD